MLPEYRIGTASWTDPTLLKAGFYPSKAKTAEARLRFYAERFDTVEVDSSYYALPNERNAALWAERTPDDFLFNIKAFALLTQHAAATRALPQAIRNLLTEEALGEPQLRRPPANVVKLSFEMFRSALKPLHDAGKLGCVLLQFPPWFTACKNNQEYVDFCRLQLPNFHLAIVIIPLACHWVALDAFSGRALLGVVLLSLLLAAIDRLLCDRLPLPLDRELAAL